MSDLQKLFSAHDKVDRWKAERENASARLDIAHINRNIAILISQHEPVASLQLDREHLRHILNFVVHGNLARLERDIADGN